MVVFPPTFPSMVYFRECTFVGRLSGQGVGRRSLCSSTPRRSHFYGCRKHWCPPAWIWINLTSSSTLVATFFAVPPPFDKKGGWHLGSTPDFFAGCSRWFTPVGIGQQNGGTTAGLSYIYDVSSHSFSAIGGRIWCGMFTPKPTPNHWLTNGSVPWDSVLALL